ncbi:MAG: HAD family hydrolase [Ruminococcaceae bacterium]|nr:HAD family hydrolase [Oscillospiraceae bacterium]
MKAIVFDMDGVLFDTEKVYFEAWDRVAAEMNIDVTEIRWKCAGHNAADIAAMFDAYFDGKVTYAEFGPRKTAAFCRILEEDGLPEKEGLHQILAFLKENGYRIALATSTRKEGAVDHLTKAGILAYFDVLTTGDMFTHGKPDPEIYLTACRLLGSDPAETYAVEDSYAGLESAHRAGMKPVMIPDLFPPTEYTRSIAAEYPSLTALMNALKETI